MESRSWAWSSRGCYLEGFNVMFHSVFILFSYLSAIAQERGVGHQLCQTLLNSSFTDLNSFTHPASVSFHEQLPFGDRT